MRRWVGALFGLGLVACGQRVEFPVLPMSPTPPPQAEASAPASPTPLRCEPLADLDAPASLRLEDLQWEALPLPGAQARHLRGSPYPMVPIRRESIEGAPFLLIGWTPSLEPSVAFPTPVATAWIDLKDAGHRWRSRGAEAPWPPCGGPMELLCKPAPTPTPMREGIRLEKAEAGTLWRIDPRTGQQEVALRLEAGWTLGEIRYARDGTYAVVVASGAPQGVETLQIWRLELQMGAPSRLLATWPVPGMGRDWVNADEGELIGSSYWVIAYPNRWGEGFLVDVERGGVVSPAALGLPADAYFLGIRLAPDGRWVAFELPPPSRKVQGPQDPGVRLYVASGADLRSGFWLEGMALVIDRWRMVGWGEHPRFLVVEDRRDGGLRLVPLPPEEAPRGYRLAGARLPLAVVPGGVVTAGEGGQVMVWDTKGQRVAAVDLRPWYRAVHALLPEVEGEKLRRVWIGAQLQEPYAAGPCTLGPHGLIEWTLP